MINLMSDAPLYFACSVVHPTYVKLADLFDAPRLPRSRLEKLIRPPLTVWLPLREKSFDVVRVSLGSRITFTYQLNIGSLGRSPTLNEKGPEGFMSDVCFYSDCEDANVSHLKAPS